MREKVSRSDSSRKRDYWGGDAKEAGVGEGRREKGEGKLKRRQQERLRRSETERRECYDQGERRKKPTFSPSSLSSTRSTSNRTLPFPFPLPFLLIASASEGERGCFLTVGGESRFFGFASGGETATEAEMEVEVDGREKTVAGSGRLSS